MFIKCLFIVQLICKHSCNVHDVCVMFARIRTFANMYQMFIECSQNVQFVSKHSYGLPLYNSRRLSSWPVLCYISNLKPQYVFEVVLTAGHGKPTNLDYLVEFINDLKDLMKNALEWKDKIYNIAVKAVVCDSPARATVKCTKQFMARFGCDQCEKRGEHDGKRMVWVGCEGVVPRTDESFRAKRQPEYHLGDGKNTPLLNLDIDMFSPKCTEH
jgi:hypothetical protein